MAADLIFVMERRHRNLLNKRFRNFLKDKQVVVLGIPDEYDYMQPELVALLKRKMQRWLRNE